MGISNFILHFSQVHLYVMSTGNKHIAQHSPSGILFSGIARDARLIQRSSVLFLVVGPSQRLLAAYLALAASQVRQPGGRCKARLLGLGVEIS